MAHFSHWLNKKILFCVFSKGLVLSSWSPRSAKRCLIQTFFQTRCAPHQVRDRENAEFSWAVLLWRKGSRRKWKDPGPVRAVRHKPVAVSEWLLIRCDQRGVSDVEICGEWNRLWRASRLAPDEMSSVVQLKNKCFGNQTRTPRAIYFHTNEYWLSTALDCSLVSCGKGGHLVRGVVTNYTISSSIYLGLLHQVQVACFYPHTAGHCNYLILRKRSMSGKFW